MAENSNTPTSPEVIALQRLILSSLVDRPADPKIFIAFPEFLALKNIRNGRIGMKIIENFYRVICNKLKPSVNSSIAIHVRFMHEAVLLFSSGIRVSSLMRDIAAMGRSPQYYREGSRQKIREMKPLLMGSNSISPNAFQ